MILLDNRVIDQVATRRLRIVKYRGSAHGSNEYPFLIDEQGFSVLPITAIGLHYAASQDIISTGIPKLDAMFGGKGYFSGGTLLVSGSAGTGKSSIAAHFIDAACRRGERCIYFAFEESPDQIVRNMRSIGIDLRPVAPRRHCCASPPRVPPASGWRCISAPCSSWWTSSSPRSSCSIRCPASSRPAARTDALAMLMRMVDLMKIRGITALFTSLTSAERRPSRARSGFPR